MNNISEPAGLPPSDELDRGTGFCRIFPGNLSENMWRGLILASAAAVTLLSYFCLSRGITIIFMHLYYFPIILLAYHYRRKGIYLSSLLGLSYLGLVVYFFPAYPGVILEATARFFVFVGIAALVGYFAGCLIRAQKETQRIADIQESSIMNANVLLMLLDAKGRILIWNNAAERITGYSAAEVKGRNDIWKLLYPEKEYRDKITGKITKIVGENNFFENLETAIRCLNGDRKIISWNTRKIQGLGDEGGRFIAIGLDITERTRAEKALLESEEKYRHLVDRANDGIAIVQDEVFKFSNPGLVRIWGGTVDEIINLPLTAIIHPVERGKIVERYQKRLAGEKVPGIYETVLLRKDGSQFPAKINAGAITYLGRPATLTILRDITDRKQVEERISHLASFPELNPNPILELNPAGEVLYTNPAVTESLHGSGAANDPRLFLPGDLHTFLPAILSGGASTIERESRSGTGSSSNTFPIPPRSGRSGSTPAI